MIIFALFSIHLYVLRLPLLTKYHTHLLITFRLNLSV